MRLIPILLTLALMAALAVFLLQRDWLLAQFGYEPDQTEEVAAPVPAQSIEKRSIKVVVTKSIEQMIDNALTLRGQTEAVRLVDVRSETSSTVISEPLRKGAFVETGQEMCVLDPGTRGASLAEAKARLSEAVARKSEAIIRKSEAETRVPEAAARLLEAKARLEEALTNENVAVRLSAGGFSTDVRIKNAQAAVAAARAAVAAAEAGVEGARSGLSGTDSGIESAQAGIESAEANVAAAEKEMERLTIRAPFAGLLESDTAELGAFLQPGSLCGTIIQLDTIKLVAFIPETEVNRIKVGADAKARLAGSEAKDIEGKVTFLSRSADATTRTFRVEVEVSNANLSIRDGQTVEITIASEGADAHLLPGSALTLNDDGMLGVRVVDAQNIVRFNPVRMIRDSAKGVWLEGLPESANVIIVGQEYVTAGTKVEPTFKTGDK